MHSFHQKCMVNNVNLHHNFRCPLCRAYSECVDTHKFKTGRFAAAFVTEDLESKNVLACLNVQIKENEEKEEIQKARDEILSARRKLETLEEKWLDIDGFFERFKIRSQYEDSFRDQIEGTRFEEGALFGTF